MYKGAPIKLSVNFSTETLQVIREGQDILEVIKKNTLQSETFYLARFSFTIEGDERVYQTNKKLRSSGPLS